MKQKILTNFPELNKAAVMDAARTLDIKRSVLVRLEPALVRSGVVGQFIGSKWIINKFHDVGLGTNMCNFTPSEVLWHELAHVMQCEAQFGGDVKAFHKQYCDDMFAGGAVSGIPFHVWPNSELYINLHWEVEANEISARYAKERPLFERWPRSIYGVRYLEQP